MTGKDVPKLENDVLKQEIWSFFWKFLIYFVPGQRSLSRDICSCPCPGTKGQRDKKNFLSRDKGTTGRPVPWKPYFVLNFWPHDSWLGTLDHLATSLVDKRHKKLGKISKNLLLIFPLPSTVLSQRCLNGKMFGQIFIKNQTHSECLNVWALSLVCPHKPHIKRFKIICVFSKHFGKMALCKDLLKVS